MGKPSGLDARAVSSRPGDRPSAGFTRRQRLLHSKDFRRVFADPCKSGSRFVILLAKTNSLDHARLGLAISRKHAKTAVARNRIKRQIRASFRLHQDELRGLDIVVIGRPGLDRVDPREFRGALDRQWRYLIKRCAPSSSC